MQFLCGVLVPRSVPFWCATKESSVCGRREMERYGGIVVTMSHKCMPSRSSLRGKCCRLKFGNFGQ